MTTSAPPLLAAALAYATRGWHIFPCHTPTPRGCSCRQDCGRMGKHPRTQHGLKDATTDEATIRRWWQQFPAANIGIVTGAISGLIVLDRDDYKGGDASLSTLEQSYHPLPDTVQQLTGGGGIHYFFRHPGSHVKNGVDTLGDGLDIRGDGGYVIAPPSRHASGKPYCWEVVHEPDEIPLASMPDWLLALCQESSRRTIPDAGEPIPHGQRNDTLFRLGCSFRAKGCTEAVILAALREMNATQCQPPLEEAEVATLAASCAQYAPGQPRTDAHQGRNGHTAGAARQAQPASNGQATSLSPPAAALITRCAADVTPEPVEWLWKPYIALGTLCMLDGDPGIGKSLLMLQLAANISQGHPFPDQTGKPTGPAGAAHNVLILTREDSLAKTIRPRLDASGAETRRVFVSANWLDAEGKEQAFTLKHLPLLQAELERLHPRLVVLDPIQSFFGDIDMHRANQTRPLLDALAALAEQHQCAIVCIRHPAKPGEGIGKALHRGLGSIDIIGAARTGLFIEQYPGDDTRALLAQTKSNLGAKGRTQIFSKKEGVFAWERVTRLTDDDLAGSGRGPHHRAFLEGLLWLEQRLEGGLVWNASDIETEAEAQDISLPVLKRAKKALGVVSAQPKGTVHPGWTWRLPPLALPSESSSDTTETTDTTDTTDTSDLKSITYADPVVRESVVSEGSEVSEVSEDQVVSDHPPSPVDPLDSVDRIDSVAPVDCPMPSVAAHPLESTPVDGNALPRRPFQPSDNPPTYAAPVSESTESTKSTPNGTHTGAHSDGMSDGVFHIAPPCSRCKGTLYWRNAGGESVCERCHPRLTREEAE